jgi:hypothetical protein
MAHLGPGVPPPPVVAIAPEFLAEWLVGKIAWKAFDEQRRAQIAQTLADWAAWVYEVPGATTGWPPPLPLGVDRRSHQDGEELATLRG